MTKIKVLMIEDEPDIIWTTSVGLQAAGYEVVTATDGEEGLFKLESTHPDAVVLDAVLPKVSGRQIASMIRNDAKYRKVPVIFISALSQKSDEEWLNSDADAYFKKPFELDELDRKIQDLLRERDNR